MKSERSMKDAMPELAFATRAVLEEDAVTKLAEERAASLVTVAGDGSPGGCGLLIDNCALWLQTRRADVVSRQAAEIRGIIAREIAEVVRQDRVRSAALVEGAVRRATERERERCAALVLEIGGDSPDAEYFVNEIRREPA